MADKDEKQTEEETPTPEAEAAEEKPKPNGERLREFADSNLASLELQLFSGKIEPFGLGETPVIW